MTFVSVTTPPSPAAFVPYGKRAAAAESGRQAAPAEPPGRGATGDRRAAERRQEPAEARGGAPRGAAVAPEKPPRGTEPRDAAADIRETPIAASQKSATEMALESAYALDSPAQKSPTERAGAATLAPEWPAVQAPPDSWMKEGPSAIQGPPAGLQQAEADYAAAQRAAASAGNAQDRFAAAAQGYSSLRLAFGGEATPNRYSSAA